MTSPFFTDEAVTIWRGDARALPIPDASVDLVVTSPPYFGLRSYTDAGEHYDGQIGAEPTPTEFLDALVAATREMIRVIKPSGSIWVNLGDKYSERANAGASVRRSGRGDHADVMPTIPNTTGFAREKSMLGLPWRYALRCIDELGLILRRDQVWSKPNAMPESVSDRCRTTHEYWFHFTTRPRYFSAIDEIREVHADSTVLRAQPHRAATTGARDAYQGMPSQVIQRDQSMHLFGRLPGSVWEIPTQPLKAPTDLGVDHYAAFPMEWPRRIILGWSPHGICTACGAGRRPVVAVEHEQYRAAGSSGRPKRQDLSGTHGNGVNGVGYPQTRTRARILDYACDCPEPTAPVRPAVVLDPFGGTGTVALVARSLGRLAWHVDLSADYCRLARWRVTDRDELARALQVEKPPAEPDDMEPLFDLAGEGAA